MSVLGGNRPAASRRKPQNVGNKSLKGRLSDTLQSRLTFAGRTPGGFLPKEDRRTFTGEMRNLLLFSDGASEAALYHDTNRHGFFAVGYRDRDGSFQQRCHPLKEMPKVIRNMDTNRDAYISQGEFTRPSRCLVNLARIGLCF